MKKIKKLLNEYSKKANFKMFALTFVIIVITTHLFPTIAKAESPGMIEKGLSSILRALAWAIQTTIIEPSGRPIQTLVFNDGITASSGTGIQLLSGNSLSLYMISIYSVIQLISVMFFVPMGLVVALDFKRSADNAQHRAILKDRIIKLVLTFMLIQAMPILLNIIFQFNNVLVDVFNNIGTKQMAGAKGFVSNGTVLMDSFKIRAETNKTLLDGALYLMATGLNLWMIFYYMIRDLTISFLFMLFPIVAIFYPFNKTMVTTWFKEMSSNILTQTIHAGILCVVLGMAVSFSEGGAAPTMYQQLFILMAFGSLIPMTGTIKKFVGLEGNVGAAKSGAGLGAAMGTMALAGGVMRAGKNAVGGIAGGSKELRNLSTEKKAVLNGTDGENTSSGMDKELPSVNKGNGLSASGGDRDSKLQDIKARQNQARKQIFQGASGAGVGVLGSGAMAVLGGGVGAKGASAGAAGGFIIGETVGNSVGGGVYDASSSVAHDMADGAYGVGNSPNTVPLTENNSEVFNGDFTKSLAHGDLKGSASAIANSAKSVGRNIKNMKGNVSDNALNRKASYDVEGMRTKEDKEEMGNTHAGVNNDAMNGTDYQSQERRAKSQQKKYMALGQPEKAFKAYANLSPKRASAEELQSISDNPGENGDMMMYRDKNTSAVYTEKETEIEGKPGEYETKRTVHWTGQGDSSLVKPSVAPVTFNNGSSDLPPELTRQIASEAEAMATKVVPHPEESEGNKMAYNSVKNNYFKNEEKRQQERIVKVRVELGSNNAYMPVRPVNHVPQPSVAQSQVKETIGNIEGITERKQELLKEFQSYSNTNGQIQDNRNAEGLQGQLNG